MPKGPPPRWTARGCEMDHLVVAAINAGLGVPLLYAGIETPERAYEIKQGFYRCGRHHGVSSPVEWEHSGAWTTKSDNWPPDRQADGTYTLRLTAHDKRSARKAHIAKYGPDRANWPYNPRRKKTQADIDAWQAQGLDERGNRVR